ncbi:hypothetical protein FQR65_LT00182 [Abscondita terminalis]|nr:hypothetical protein FQR65_LT00182 [Abscondita terminalis]
MSSASDFYTALKPCHTLQLYLGLADFTVEGSINNRTLKVFRIRSWYKLTFIVLSLIVTAVFILLNDVIAPFKSENVFYWFVAFYDLHSDYIAMMALLISSLLFRETLIKSCHQIFATDALLHSFKSNLNNVFVAHFSQLMMFFHFTCNTLAHFTSDDVVSHQEIKYFVVSNVLYWILNFYRICTSCVFQTWVLSLKLRFEALHEWIYQNEKRMVATELHQIRKLHQQLCEIARDINKVYTLPNLFNLNMNLLIFILQAYNIAILLTNDLENWIPILNTLVYLIWTGFEIVSVVVCCALLSRHENMLRRRLFALSNVNTCLQREVKSLSIQMMHFNSELTLPGYMSIDAPLLYQPGYCKKLLDNCTIQTRNGELFCKCCYELLFACCSPTNNCAPSSCNTCVPFKPMPKSCCKTPNVYCLKPVCSKKCCICQSSNRYNCKRCDSCCPPTSCNQCCDPCCDQCFDICDPCSKPCDSNCPPCRPCDTPCCFDPCCSPCDTPRCRNPCDPCDPCNPRNPCDPCDPCEPCCATPCCVPKKCGANAQKYCSGPPPPCPTSVPRETACFYNRNHRRSACLPCGSCCRSPCRSRCGSPCAMNHDPCQPCEICPPTCPPTRAASRCPQLDPCRGPRCIYYPPIKCCEPIPSEIICLESCPIEPPQKCCYTPTSLPCCDPCKSCQGVACCRRCNRKVIPTHIVAIRNEKYNRRCTPSKKLPRPAVCIIHVVSRVTAADYSWTLRIDTKVAVKFIAKAVTESCLELEVMGISTT